MDKSKCMWCVISGIGKRSVFGYTADNELVVMFSNWRGLRGVQPGDIVAFIPEPFVGKDSPASGDHYATNARWFGVSPTIIGLRPASGGLVGKGKHAAQDSSADDARLFSQAFSSNFSAGEKFDEHHKL